MSPRSPSRVEFDLLSYSLNLSWKKFNEESLENLYVDTVNCRL